ncbi:MAG: hypothetical protein NTU44_09920, partial [Bacteroidetes bacterium]|nr:hypothetical protein [Bacteroidota bacterium]
MSSIKSNLLFLFLLSIGLVSGQNQPLRFTSAGTVTISKGTVVSYTPPVLFSLMINDTLAFSNIASVDRFGDDSISWTFPQGLLITGAIVKDFSPGMKISLHLINRCKKDLKVENFVPFSEGKDHTYITAGGSREWPQYLCRSVLIRPGFAPVGVVLPDNAWHLGFCSFKADETSSLTGLCRRGKREKASVDRWAVTLQPGGMVDYNFYLDIHAGGWRESLALWFRERYLYDLPHFDNSLLERPDLQWMRHSYLMLLRFAWDHDYYDGIRKENTFCDNFHEYDQLLGGWDIFTLWPTWPRLGLDPRNQWDMYRDLPGGLPALKKQAYYLHQ